MTPRLSQSPRWPKVESITTRQLHYCWDKRPPVYKQLWVRAWGPRQDSTVLDETGALARASNQPLYAFALLWTSYSLSFGDSDTGHSSLTPASSFRRVCIHSATHLRSSSERSAISFFFLSYLLLHWVKDIFYLKIYFCSLYIWGLLP